MQYLGLYLINNRAVHIGTALNSFLKYRRSAPPLPFAIRIHQETLPQPVVRIGAA